MNSAAVTVVSSVMQVVRPMRRVLMRVLLVMVSMVRQSEMAMLLLVFHATKMMLKQSVLVVNLVQSGL